MICSAIQKWIVKYEPLRRISFWKRRLCKGLTPQIFLQNPANHFGRITTLSNLLNTNNLKMKLLIAADKLYNAYKSLSHNM